jgi:ABC-type enterochelin transport system substrate-binding protein
MKANLMSKNIRYSQDFEKACQEHGTIISQNALANSFDELDHSQIVAMRFYGEDENTVAVVMASEGEVLSDFWPASRYYVISSELFWEHHE